MITLVVGPLEVNCYLVWDRRTGQAVVIDPGGNPDIIADTIRREKLKVEYVVNTHAHFDHVGANVEMKKRFGAMIAVHREDVSLLASAHDYAAFYGSKTPMQPAPDIMLEDGSKIKTGGLTLEVIHTPGHTRGGVCLYNRKEGVLFTGDTLFAGSVGRTDFEGGSMEELMNSIRTKILPLGDDVKVCPGHGPQTTIGAEKANNPFLTGNA